MTVENNPSRQLSLLDQLAGNNRQSGSNGAIRSSGINYFRIGLPRSAAAAGSPTLLQVKSLIILNSAFCTIFEVKIRARIRGGYAERCSGINQFLSKRILLICSHTKARGESSFLWKNPACPVRDGLFKQANLSWKTQLSKYPCRRLARPACAFYQAVLYKLMGRGQLSIRLQFNFFFGETDSREKIR